jgi:hypothetical protein
LSICCSKLQILCVIFHPFSTVESLFSWNHISAVHHPITCLKGNDVNSVFHVSFLEVWTEFKRNVKLHINTKIKLPWRSDNHWLNTKHFISNSQNCCRLVARDRPARVMGGLSAGKLKAGCWMCKRELSSPKSPSQPAVKSASYLICSNLSSCWAVCQDHFLRLARRTRTNEAVSLFYVPSWHAQGQLYCYLTVFWLSMTPGTKNALEFPAARIFSASNYWVGRTEQVPPQSQ